MKRILEDICVTLRNCANCKECDPEHELKCYAGLDIITPEVFHIEPYDDKTNQQLIKIAHQHNYGANIVTDYDEEYIDFYKKS